jgi:glycosyltransferase involved in cell wall biosynthesis
MEAVLYGDGEDRESVEKLLKSDCAGLAITLAGRIEPEAVQREMLRAQAFVLLSAYEGLPLALLETMACGVVPVCSHIRSGHPELICHGANGFLVEPGMTIAPFLSILRSDRRRWEKMSASAREKIIDGYTDSASHDHWHQFLSRLARDGRRSGGMPRRLSASLPPINPRLAGIDDRLPGIGARVRTRLARVAASFSKLASP